MKVSILRKKDRQSEEYMQEFTYSGEMHISIVNLLEYLNKEIADSGEDDRISYEICFESSCHQGLCGACAMVVNDRPVLACQTFCDEVADKEGNITIRPLSKFPVIKDLSVDRKEIYDSMKQAQLWLEKSKDVSKKALQSQSQAALCLMCGCCLEACPNYVPDDMFKGMPVALSALNLISKSVEGAHKEDMKKNYKEQVFNGCTKSMACEKVCPMKIPTVTLMSEANRLSVWKLWKLICK